MAENGRKINSYLMAKIEINGYFKTLDGKFYDSSLMVDKELNDDGNLCIKVFGYNSMAEIELDFDQLIVLREAINSAIKEIEEEIGNE